MKFWPVLTKILIRKERIAGLEITDTHVRLLLLKLNRKTGVLSVHQSLEESLESGTIINGVLKKPARLASALFKLKKKFKPRIQYVIVSIPSDIVYDKILSFPKSVEEKKLEEAIMLAINFQLPYKANDVYYSWEIFQEDTRQKAFVVESPKKFVDSYLECVRDFFHPVAVEFHALSFARIASFKEDQPIMLKVTGPSSAGFFIIKEKLIEFSRILGPDFPPKKLAKEMEKFINFYQAASGEKIVKILELAKDIPPIEKNISFPELKKNGKWLISLGAALRGITPRSQDNFISLMSIGTEKAFEYQKIVSFISLLTKLTVVLSTLLVSAYLGVWLLMVSLQQKAVKQIESLSSAPLPVGLSEAENKVKEVNTLISAANEILKNAPQWSILINELKEKTFNGIIIGGMSLPSPEGILNMTGVAANRQVLNQFRDELIDSEMLKEVNLPLTNLEQKENIPFTISFKLRGPELIYPK